VKYFFLNVFSFLLLCILAACSASEQKVLSQDKTFNLNFELVSTQALACNASNKKTLLKDFRMYIHALKFNGELLSLESNEWQTDGVALLDFSDSDRHCKNSQLSANQSIRFRSKNISEAGVLAFSIGVPQNLNHQNPVKAQTPLNRSDMHWQWLSGYKFMRLEYSDSEGDKRFHLGSIACAGKIPDQVDCKFPNRPNIILDNVELGKNSIKINADKLFSVAGQALCMGDPEDEACKSWLKMLQADDLFYVD